MPERRRSYLLVPAGGAGEGIGHLLRCIRLSESLGPRVSFLTSHLDASASALLVERLSRVRARVRPAVLTRLPGSARWDLIVVDARRCARAELHALQRHGLVVCLDEGGEARQYAPFLVDALPGTAGRPANLASPSFLSLPRRMKGGGKARIRKVLISFGGEDRENLSERLIEALLRTQVVRPDQLTLVEGPLFPARAWPQEIAVLRGVAELSRVLPAYDLFITHFGTAAFEALAAGVPVILLNPSAYHARLGAAAGFATLGTSVPNMRTLHALMEDPAPLRAHVEEFNQAIGRDRARRLPDLLERLTLIGSSSCPVCGRTDNPVVARFEDRTYRRCAACSVVALESFAGTRRKYGARYFSSEYKAQYGRTYLEDFDAIKAASRQRAAIIRGALGRDVDGVVVDVGCAYGPFLDALREAGTRGFGLDVSAAAVAYVKKKLGIPAVCAAFEEVTRAQLPRQIAALTLWYVIEHFPDTDFVLSKAAELLPTGGVFAFSTPNGRGISARRSLQEFLRKSPGDHFTVFSPRRLRRLLARYDMQLVRIRVTGHHPERFPGLLGRAAGARPGIWRFLRAASVFLRLGDTFEAYAVRGER